MDMFLALLLSRDNAGNLWIGTAGGGLQRFRDGSLLCGPPPTGFPQFGLGVPRGCGGRALDRHRERVESLSEPIRFTAFTAREGLPANLVNEILEDDFGNLWISHEHGIYRVRKQELNEVAAGRAKSVQAVGATTKPTACRRRNERPEKVIPPAARRARPVLVSHHQRRGHHCSEVV